MHPGKQHLDEGEFLNVEYIPVNEVLAMIDEGKIRDAKTIVAMLQYIRGRH